MLGIIYVVFFALLLSYLCARISNSVVRSNVNERFFYALVSSIFWFVSIPYMIFTGDLRKSQIEIDEEIYNKYLDMEICSILDSMEKSGAKVGESEKENLRKSVGSFEEMLADLTYFSRPVTQEELAGLIAYRYYKKNKVLEKHRDGGAIKFVLKEIDDMFSVSKEIGKTRIGEEGKTTCSSRTHPLSELTGFHTLQTGLTFLGVLTNTRSPYFFIIYYDGEKLQAYVPNHNSYNKQNGKAFGENKDDDSAYLKGKFKEIDGRRLFAELKKTLDPDRTLKEIARKVNYIPRKGKDIEQGWDDIHFDKVL